MGALMTAPITDLKAGAMNPRTQDREIDDRVVTRPVMRVWQASETADVAEATLDVLRICGVEVRHPKALALLAAAGAQVEGTRVRFPAELVKSALDTAPAHVTVGARGSSQPLELGRGLSYFGTGPDCLYVTPSAEESRRRVDVEDVRAMAALCQQLGHIDFVMSMGLPEDTPAETADLVQFAAMLSGTTKPLVISSPRDGAPLHEMRQMAEMCGDAGSFACLVMSSPPLQIDAEAAVTTLLGGLSRADLLHDVGYLESGMQSSAETIVLGNELVGYVKRLYTGVPTDNEALAVEEIRAAGPGGNHLARRYTRDHRRDFWVSDLFDHSVYDRWEAGGSSTLRERVRRLTRSLRVEEP